MKVVVFAGGVGTRLWPLSRKNSPKQFGKLVGEQSTLQQAVERLIPEFNPSDIFIATGEQYKDMVVDQLPAIPKENFIFEPSMQDVGPAIGLTAMILDKKFGSEPVAILWSDHVVKKEQVFHKILRHAEKQIKDGKSDFIFIAQKARFANQNCGWIELGDEIDTENSAKVYKFKRLWYRPKQEEADEFFRNHNFVWNLGYFVTTPAFLKKMYHKFMPEMFEKLHEIQSAVDTPGFNSALKKIYPTLDKISFDDAILVKLNPDNFLVVAADLGWSDVGTWDSLKESLVDKKEENITNGAVLLEGTTDTLLFNYTDKLCLGIDLNEMIIINTDDVLLVCSKKSVPKIKKLVEKLKDTPYKDLV